MKYSASLPLLGFAAVVGFAACSSGSTDTPTQPGSDGGTADVAVSGSCASCILTPNGGATGNSWCQATSSCTKLSDAVKTCDWGFSESEPGCNAQALAATALPIDCRAPKNRADARCFDGTPEQGKTGSGEIWNGPVGVLRGGFMDDVGGRLIVAYNEQKHGALFSVDVESGERKIVSGAVTTTLSGLVTVGTGLEAVQFLDVKTGPDGWYVIARASDAQKAILLKVDPATGNRTTLYDARTTAGACKIGSASLDFATVTNGSSARDLDPYIAVGADGTVYARVNNSDVQGLAAFKDGTCTVVSSYSATPALAKGTGPIITAMTGMVFKDGGVIGLIGYDLLVKFDLATGNRTVVSSHVTGAKVGNGDALYSNFVDLSADRTDVITTGVDDGANGYPPGARPQWVTAKIASGDRTPIFTLAGPHDRVNQVFTNPKHTDRMVLTTKHGVFSYEPASGNVTLLSY